jgi:hypothetical protein
VTMVVTTLMLVMNDFIIRTLSFVLLGGSRVEVFPREIVPI